MENSMECISLCSQKKISRAIKIEGFKLYDAIFLFQESFIKSWMTGLGNFNEEFSWK
jgi:hypothetical protein